MQLVKRIKGLENKIHEGWKETRENGGRGKIMSDAERWRKKEERKS